MLRQPLKSCASVEVSVPGKLVLLGEYAVLYGAPALVMAVNRRAVARLVPVQASTYRIDSNSGERSSIEFTLAPTGRVQWQAASGESAARFTLVGDVIEGLCEDKIVDATELTPFKACLDTSGFFERGPTRHFDKLGLGSSAALTTALASAVGLYAGRASLLEERQRWLECLCALHRHFQRGQGSGLDVAASVYGGLIRFHTAGSGASPTATPLEWPAELQALFVWSGRSASTRRLVERVHAWREKSVGAHALTDELSDIAATGARAAESGDAAAIVAAAGAYAKLLSRLGEASGADIVSAEHRAIARLAHAAGAAYKPCGAGGGDVGVALTDEPDRIRYLSRSLDNAGYKVLALCVDPQGLITRTEME